MSANWRRWLAYGRARLDSAVRAGDEELERREARLEAEAEGKPWLTSSGAAPTFEEAKARIEHEAREAEAARPGPSDPARPEPTPSEPSPGPATTPSPSPDGAPVGRDSGTDAWLDLAAQQKATDERLAAIREELGLADEPDAT